MLGAANVFLILPLVRSTDGVASSHQSFACRSPRPQSRLRVALVHRAIFFFKPWRRPRISSMGCSVKDYCGDRALIRIRMAKSSAEIDVQVPSAASLVTEGFSPSLFHLHALTGMEQAFEAPMHMRGIAIPATFDAADGRRLSPPGVAVLQRFTDSKLGHIVVTTFVARWGSNRPSNLSEGDGDDTNTDNVAFPPSLVAECRSLGWFAAQCACSLTTAAALDVIECVLAFPSSSTIRTPSFVKRRCCPLSPLFVAESQRLSWSRRHALPRCQPSQSASNSSRAYSCEPTVASICDVHAVLDELLADAICNRSDVPSVADTRTVSADTDPLQILEPPITKELQAQRSGALESLWFTAVFDATGLLKASSGFFALQHADRMWISAMSLSSYWRLMESHGVNRPSSSTYCLYSGKSRACESAANAAFASLSDGSVGSERPATSGTTTNAFEFLGTSYRESPCQVRRLHASLAAPELGAIHMFQLSRDLIFVVGAPKTAALSQRAVRNVLRNIEGSLTPSSHILGYCGRVEDAIYAGTGAGCCGAKARPPKPLADGAPVVVGPVASLSLLPHREAGLLFAHMTRLQKVLGGFRGAVREVATALLNELEPERFAALDAGNLLDLDVTAYATPSLRLVAGRRRAAESSPLPPNAVVFRDHNPNSASTGTTAENRCSPTSAQRLPHDVFAAALAGAADSEWMAWPDDAAAGDGATAFGVFVGDDLWSVNLQPDCRNGNVAGDHADAARLALDDAWYAPTPYAAAVPFHGIDTPFAPSTQQFRCDVSLQINAWSNPLRGPTAAAAIETPFPSGARRIVPSSDDDTSGDSEEGGGVDQMDSKQLARRRDRRHWACKAYSVVGAQSLALSEFYWGQKAGFATSSVTQLVSKTSQGSSRGGRIDAATAAARLWAEELALRPGSVCATALHAVADARRRDR